MLFRISLKTLGILSFILLAFTANATKPTAIYSLPIANAGADQTIYLTQTSSIILDGSASIGDTYLWTDISTDYKSSAIIASPTSLITKVTGLTQGTWYYELAVSTGQTTVKDTVVIRVDYDVPPINGTLLKKLPLKDLAYIIDNRSDTVSSWNPLTDPKEVHTTYFQNATENVWIDRARVNGMMIDSSRGKLYSTIEDGYRFYLGDYNRSELGYESTFRIDTNKTYIFEWKGYFSQSFNFLKAIGTQNALTIFQLHPGDEKRTLFEFSIENDGHLSVFENAYNNSGTQFQFLSKKLSLLTNFYNNTHTLRTTIKEGKGYLGQTALVKVELDGRQVYLRDTGNVGSTAFQKDYVKYCSMYDHHRMLVNPDSVTRGRKVSLVTEEFRVYELNGTTRHLQVNAGKDQTVILPTNSVKLIGSFTGTDKEIRYFKWTEISGPSNGTINNPNSDSTPINNLSQGVYRFELNVTDHQGNVGKDTVQITVNAAPNISPTAHAGEDKEIVLPTDSVSISGDGTDPDGTISSYSWTKVSGPSGETMSNADSATTFVNNLTKGVYQFQLKITDDKGAIGKDTVQITLSPVANLPPKANAGPNKTIMLPVSSIVLTGSATDADGQISKYLWTKMSGPVNYKIENPNSAVTNVTKLTEGIYKFQFAVKDDQGAIASSTVQIVVNPPLNIPPVSNADSNKIITLPTNKVLLSGSGNDSDGTISSYSWTKISGPSAYNISNSSSAVTTISGLVQGVYLFELKVTDDKGSVGKDMVEITVNAAPNMPPTADAGSNQSITLPINTITINGSGSDDGTISSYSWMKISGPSGGTINNANSAFTTVTGLEQGIYEFELQVTDNNGATGKDTMQLTVNTALNQPPTTNAGGDLAITLPTNTVTLNGSGKDTDGTVAIFFWKKISGPSSFNITNTASPKTDVSGILQGVYEFELQVSDNNGAVGRDTVRVTVNAAANIVPVANAGSNKTITLPVNTVSLAGSGTDVDGTITNYLWTKISGPSAYNIGNSSSAVTTVSGLVQGAYQFELKVTDDRGATGKDTVEIMVNAAPNIPPTADAGSNQSITLPINKITINGSGSDLDGTISSYSWIKIAGPSGETINNANSASSLVNTLSEGVYQFELKVTDDKGAVGKDTVQVTVNAAPNLPPTANAGADKTITLPTNSVSLSGRGTDSDGTIFSYAWTKISGPTAYNISNSSSAVLTVSRLVEGTYLFELTVTDDKGATGIDTVQITVNAAANISPTANAGGDKTITLPVNIFSLAGSGKDVDGTITNYLWTKISGPSTFNIVNASSPVTDVSGLAEGIYLFELKVTDDKGSIGKDTVQAIVNPAQNMPPTANAGADKTITLPMNSVLVSGSGIDSDGIISSYSWSNISGPSTYNISNASSPLTTVSGLIQGVYDFELKITDDKGATGKDTIQITVNAGANISPTASAGGDKTITLPTDSVFLFGNGTDPDGTISSYSWSKISGPSAFSIKNCSSPTSEVSGLVEGVYLFEFKVTDNNGAPGNDTIKVIVEPAINIAPVAQAGSDQTITFPTNTISLNGNGVDSDGTISTYLWTKIAGPATGTITDASSALTTVKGLIPGNYIFQLTVTDNKGAKGTDSIYVTVNAPKNIAPIANAGGDLTIVLPLNTVYLNGSGNDTDGTITAYQWKQITGPDSASISNENSASTLVKNLVGGTYEFELTVTDNNGATGSDTVSVVVALGRISPEQNSINIYPNPVNDMATVEINTAEPTSNLSILISDFGGRIVYKKKISSIEYHAVEKINMSNFSKGPYTISVFFDGTDKQIFPIIKL